ncbi:hypothetical protein SAMN04244573_04635 [Azotobacter beijerinckii]|uniref:Uncharacterized protein n=1 Tax=Azotobacter beijerinckii TaxID=170623 RepID=A0A1H9TCC2_9GAMM|nr:hypothetical protein [Azotobacter beijerinckii]SER94862.1 hypothetical protein SAMN04244573_04635 [Azotobacter beijerinckii]
MAKHTSKNPLHQGAPFKRKPWLGRYNATRAEWKAAYRAARIAIGQGAEPDPATDGVLWKAQLVVAYERSGHGDRLKQPASVKLAAKRLMDEIVGAA